MKPHGIGLGILTAALLLGSHPASAHEGQEHRRNRISAMAGSETVVPSPAAETIVVIKLFQFGCAASIVQPHAAQLIVRMMRQVGAAYN